MNTLLQDLFDKYNLPDKNRYEINQIFGLLPPDKKQNILNNFDLLTLRLNKIEEDIRIERQILIGDSLISIKNILEIIKK